MESESSRVIEFPNDKWLHRFSLLVVATTVVLIYAGGLVTTIGAGLAVPDWPLSFGSLNPSGWWKQPMVREEHGHRLIGATVGLMTLILCIWIQLRVQKKWLRTMGYVALATVIVQGILGGLRVIDKNIYFAMIHACLAQAFFCILITISWGTSRVWTQNREFDQKTGELKTVIPTIACVSVYLQLIVGAIMRHSGAGMAIPTFPLIFGGIFPPEWNFGIGIHYVHRVWAFVVLILIVVLAVKSTRSSSFWLRIMANTALGLTFVQIGIGGLLILTGRGILPTTLHVVVGALILASTFSCALLQYRQASADES